MQSDAQKNAGGLPSSRTQDTVNGGVRESVPSTGANLYLLGEVGHIYTFAEYPSNTPAEPMCTFLGLSVDEGKLQLEVDGRQFSESACITAPRTVTMLPCTARTAVFVFYPPTATHRAMQIVHEPRFKALMRDHFRQFDDALAAAAMGLLTIADATTLFHSIAAVVARFLPTPPALDSRVATVLQVLFADTTVPIDELAAKVRLSPDRLSHLFTDTLGIDLRRYRLWLKIGRAAVIFASKPEISMGELAILAGFSDSAHLSRAVKEVYGGSPTRFLPGIKVHASS